MLLEKMKKIPVLSMANFGQYVQMLHYMLFQEEIQRQEFQFQTVIEDGKKHLPSPGRRAGRGRRLGFHECGAHPHDGGNAAANDSGGQSGIQERAGSAHRTGASRAVPGGGTVPAPEKRPDDFLRAMHPRRDSGRHAPADRIRDGNGALRSPGARCHHDGVADGQSPHDGGLHPQGA